MESTAAAKQLRYYLLLHFIVLLWGFSPILGKLISFGEFKLVLWRIILTLPPMLLWVWWIKGFRKLGLRDTLQVAGIGVIVAAHWLCFYGAIKVSNVSVTMIAFSCGALFTAFIEPLFYRRRIDRMEIVFGLIVIAAIIMISNVEETYIWGIILGILAAFGSSLFSVLNGIMVKRGLPVSMVSVMEMGAGLLVLLLYGALSGGISFGTWEMNGVDLLWMLTLSLACTAFSFIAGMEVMRELSPYTVNLTVNLESVYAIILAWFIFGETERMTPLFYAGAAIILLTVLANGWYRIYRK